MFNFHGQMSDYDKNDLYICAVRDDYDVGDMIEKGSFQYKIIDIDTINQLMMIAKRKDRAWKE